MDRRDSSMARTVPTVITGLVVGGLFSAAAAGTRGYSFLFAFMLTSGFVIGVGCWSTRLASGSSGPIEMFEVQSS